MWDRLFVVLVGARNPLNIGAAARAMSNFGFSNLRLVNPYSVAFREARSAVGALAVLKRATEFQNLSEAVADCSLVIGTTAGRNRKLDHELLPLKKGVRLIRRHPGNAALLFGSEKRGLSKRDFNYCHWLMRIPTFEMSPSMNLGQAVAICLYELAREQAPAFKPKTRPLTASSDLDRLTTILLDALRLSGYTKPSSAPVDDEKVRRLLRRLNISSDDTSLLQGMFRQMLWKMSND